MFWFTLKSCSLPGLTSSQPVLQTHHVIAPVSVETLTPRSLLVLYQHHDWPPISFCSCCREAPDQLITATPGPQGSPDWPASVCSSFKCPPDPCRQHTLTVLSAWASSGPLSCSMIFITWKAWKEFQASPTDWLRVHIFWWSLGCRSCSLKRLYSHSLWSLF